MSILSVPYGRESSIMIVLSMLMALLAVVVVNDSLALLKRDKQKAIKETHVGQIVVLKQVLLSKCPK